MTFQEFQIKVMSQVFKIAEKNEFEATLYMLTGDYRRKKSIIPPELFKDPSDIAKSCKRMNKLAKSIHCCFVSQCNFTRIDKESCDELGINFDTLDMNTLTDEQAHKLYNITIEGLVFNFESLNEEPKVMMFKKDKSGNYIPSVGFGENDALEQTSGNFNNLLDK